MELKELISFCKMREKPLFYALLRKVRKKGPVQKMNRQEDINIPLPVSKIFYRKGTFTLYLVFYGRLRPYV